MEIKTPNIALCKGLWVPESGEFLLVQSGKNSESQQRLESIRNPSSTDKKSGIQYLKSGILGLESGIQLKESGIPLTIGIRNPSSTDKKIWNPVPGIRNPQRGIQNPVLSSISLHGAT